MNRRNNPGKAFSPENIYFTNPYTSRIGRVSIAFKVCSKSTTPASLPSQVATSAETAVPKRQAFARLKLLVIADLHLIHPNDREALNK
ncbi:MAG: hypothetical protein JW920_04470 [Deltaproteobacteria bacterium]|nr:hypothetical protein [Deltaproteobacteria bacterium]